MILVDVFAVIIVFTQLWINKMTCDNWRLEGQSVPSSRDNLCIILNQLPITGALKLASIKQ